MVQRIARFQALSRLITALAGISLFCLSFNSFSQDAPKTPFNAANAVDPLQRVVAAGCRIFLIEETGLQETRFLQAFELEERGTLEPGVGQLVRTLGATRANKGIGVNTYQRYLSRVETAVAAEDHSNLSDEELVTRPVALKQAVSISKQSAMDLNAYKYALMETEAGDEFRARRDAFLSIFPDTNKNLQIASLLRLCPTLEGLEEALRIFDQN